MTTIGTIGRPPLSAARAWTALSWTMVLAGALAVASTARVFSGTVDEPAHLAAGMQWLSTGEYSYDLQHPPLGRIAAAMGPYVRGARSAGNPAIYDEGAKILGTGARYSEMLASARHGELVFFVLLALVVWLWAKSIIGDAGAAVATLLLVANPNVLAHAGLATTDIACTATSTLALFLAVRWVESPTMGRALSFGAGAALAAGSRLSALAFVGGALVVSYALYAWVARRATIARGRESPRVSAQLGASALLFALMIWAIYRFAIGPMHPGGASVPAPAFLSGVDAFLLHGSSGHPSFLLGTPANRGWWYYFPVALAVKTPIPLLLLSIVGAVAAFADVKTRRDWRTAVPVAAALTMLVDQHHRARGPRRAARYCRCIRCSRSRPRRGRCDSGPRDPRSPLVRQSARCSRWSLLIVVRAHPDHLAYFNALAGDHPEHVLVDSNLDWGQDLYRLRDTIVARGIRDTVRVAYFGTADVAAAGVPHARELGLHERATGWIAASETYLAGEWVGHAYDWLLDYPPVARIGPSMRLWYIPPAVVTTDSSRRSAR